MRELPSMSDLDLGTSRIHISPAAAAKLHELLEEEGLAEEPEAGVRLSLRLGAGCSGRSSVAMALAPRPKRRDNIVEAEGGLRVFLDDASAWSLDGLVVDYAVSEELGEGFVFGRLNGDAGPSCC
jgi:Fe-S cluster assembly iron-binding protein IscA